MESPAEQYQMMTAIWPKWRAVATSTSAASDPESAVRALYQFYNMPDPEITWLTRLNPLPIDDNPFICHFRESLIFSVWHKLADPAWACSQIGYDRRANTFRLPANKRSVFSQSRITRQRRRPPWLLQTNNIVSQLDADVLAIQELAAEVGSRDRQIKQLTKLITDIVTGCFAALLFQRTCFLIGKPQSVILNDGQQLSAQGEPAITWHDPPLAMFMMNGELLTLNQPPWLDTSAATFQKLCYMAPRDRVLHIEYMGWEQFYEMMKRLRSNHMTMVDKDDYGTLYRVLMMNQQFIIVRVKNRTPEPDGSYRHYVIPVDNRCRPLPDPNKPHERHGAPQELSALNAVASTFGMRGKEYAALLGAES